MGVTPAPGHVRRVVDRFYQGWLREPVVAELVVFLLLVRACFRGDKVLQPGVVGHACACGRHLGEGATGVRVWRGHAADAERDLSRCASFFIV